MIVLCALVRFHAFVYFWVNYMIVITEFCFTCMAKKKTRWSGYPKDEF